MWRPASSSSDAPPPARRFGPPEGYDRGGPHQGDDASYGPARPPPRSDDYSNHRSGYSAVPPPASFDRSGPHHAGGGGGGGGGHSSYRDEGPAHSSDKRGREEERAPAHDDPDAPRKRRSRWGDDKPVQSGALPTALMNPNVSQLELDQYAIRMRVEEINNRLRSGDVVPPERQRSPSPPPTYDAHGRRTNTREVRYRRKLEDERVKLVDKALKLDPAFRPPTEYHAQKRNSRPQDKVYIPVKEFPEINFFGLLVGPRGNSLKKMERESGAKISIRGKGSVKEGKGRPETQSDDADEDLHCLIMGDTPEKVRACVDLINNVIATAASTPEAQNDHKRNQLRELAALNGTLRDDEGQICQNCGGVGHKKWDCPEQRNYSAGIICHRCGGAGHMARDCRNAPGSGGGPPGGPPGGKFDAEYASLMSELGEGGGTAMGGAAGLIAGPGGEGGAAGARPPWAAGSGAGDPSAPIQPRLAPWRDPNNWITPNQRMQGGYGGGGYGGQPQGQPGGYADYYQNLGAGGP